MKAWSVDEEAFIDGGPLEFGGIEVGGLVAVYEIAAILGDELAKCECTEFNPNEPVLVHGERYLFYELACTQEFDGCSTAPNPLCESISLLCSVLPSMPSFGMNEIGSNGNRIGDSLSTGLRVSAEPARLAVSAFVP